MPTPRKSVQQHELEGTRVNYEVDPKPSRFVAGRPSYPRHLSAAARAEFKRCVKLLEERGTLTPGDAATLAVYSECFARWIQAKAELGTDLMIEVTVTDSNGKAHTSRRLNPLIKVVEACESRVLTLAKAMGLTPVDREKARPAAPENETGKRMTPEEWMKQ
ncbi:MAG: phage terminase small subunit P27 family [Candidatus Acidiferrales bacterium]